MQIGAKTHKFKIAKNVELQRQSSRKELQQMFFIRSMRF